ncbi:MAG TPA: endo-1,3-alpha-glucanase family glycosylhydrolase [Candidatus Angelobacter sp.]|jgi:hypothetical protein|nr:endo-1,3-alpha-glucanase family glycosylhydrolase [Candidatus Angelobacter sp.]
MAMKFFAALVLFISACLSGLAAAGERPTRSIEEEATANTSAAGTNAHVSRLPIRSLLYPGATTKIYVRVMPWFGDSKHVQVGYRSDDARQISSQVQDMMSRGIDAAIVDWYGPDHGVSSQATDMLFRESQARGFGFGVSVDGGPIKDCQKKGCDVTGFVLAELKYAEKNYESSPNYVRWQGRPLVFFFDGDKYPVDWNYVRSSLRLNPMFIFRNSGAFDSKNDDGAFSWIAPETVNPSDPLGLQYLDRFYTRAQRSPNKFAVGSVYKGFNDERASWGSGRRIPDQCGQTWLETFAAINRHYSASNQLPALLIVTWNDYEEGTSIEPGVGCAADLKAWIDGSKVKWNYSGSRNQVDHFAIFDSPDQRTLVKIGEVKQGETSFDLRSQNLQGRHRIYVKAVGRASMVDSLSAPVELGRGERERDSD